MNDFEDGLAELAAFLERDYGLRFDEHRIGALAHVVRDRMAATESSGLAAYLALLEGGAELQRLVDDVTIGETHFLRNPPQMQAIRDQLLPRLLSAAAASSGRLQIWSAGCSTGEEAYSVGLLALEVAARVPGVSVRVLGTDVSERAIEVARQGWYAERQLRLLSTATRQRWLRPVGDGWSVDEQLRRVVEFRRHNLVAEPPPFTPGSVQLLLCRNVTIYFGRPTTRALMARLHECLDGDGFLLLGHAETLWQLCDGFTVEQIGDAFCYRRTDAATTAPMGEPTAARPRARHRAPALDRPLVATQPGRAETAPGTPGQPTGEQARPSAAGPAAHERADVDRVRLFLRTGRYEAAEQAAVELLRGATDASSAALAHYLRGLALTSQHYERRAVTALRAAVRLDSGLGMAHFLLAGSLARLGDAAAAADSYRQAAAVLRVRPPDPRSPELDGRDAADLVSLCEVLGRRDGPPR